MAHGNPIWPTFVMALTLPHGDDEPDYSTVGAPVCGCVERFLANIYLLDENLDSS